MRDLEDLKREESEGPKVHFNEKVEQIHIIPEPEYSDTNSENSEKHQNNNKDELEEVISILLRNSQLFSLRVLRNCCKI